MKRGAMNYIPENSFPDFLNLVVWGHEHECMVDPIPVEGKDYYIIQPGIFKKHENKFLKVSSLEDEELIIFFCLKVI